MDKSLTLLRREGAQAAIKGHARAKGGRPRGEALLALATNPDLQDDIVDLIADVLIHARTDLDLDVLDIISAAVSHVGSLDKAHAALQPLRADRFVVKATAPDGAVSWLCWNTPGKSPHREQATRFASMDAATNARLQAQGFDGAAFWRSERESAEATRKAHKGWTFEVEPA